MGSSPKGAPWHDVAKMSMSHGDRGSLCRGCLGRTAEAEVGACWHVLGSSWDPQCKECHGGAAELRLLWAQVSWDVLHRGHPGRVAGIKVGMGWGFLRCSAQRVIW